MKWLYGGVGEAGGTHAEHDLEDDYDLEPVDIGDFSYGNMHLVGHGEVTNANCGRFLKWEGCSRGELHDRITLDGKNYKGKGYMKPIFNSCDKPSCPVCYKYGWAGREAGNITSRLAEASKRFGQVEHIVLSIPSRDYDLAFGALRTKGYKILKKVGVIGGVVIFHGFRFNLLKGWYWSPHLHVLGFIRGGFARCRRCRPKEFQCRSCDGMKGRCYRIWKETGYIVSVKGKRKTVRGTAWYQLNHSSFDVTKKQKHIASWFGVCHWRKLKVAIERKKRVCPICHHELRQHRYHGSKQTILDYYRAEACSCKIRELIVVLEEGGRLVWEEYEKRGYSYG